MKITTLIENRPSLTDPQLAAEWGLSLHIEFNGSRILFDTGSSGAFAKNAERLSVRVDDVDAAVLSHHHFDHGGGLRRFFELNAGAKVYCGRPPAGDCCAKIFGFVEKYVGLDKAIFQDYPGRFEIAEDPVELLPDVFLFPRIHGSHPKPSGNRHLFLKRNNSLEPDDFAHEIVMAIREKGKLAVFTGCSHNGLLNMVDMVARAFEGGHIGAVIGGFHLLSAPPLPIMSGTRRDVEDLGRAVLNYPIDVTYTGHCTGKRAFGVLKSVMDDRLRDMRTGDRFEL